MSIQDLISIFLSAAGMMKRDCTPVCGLFSLKYYKRNNVITFPSKVIHLQLYQLSPSDSLKHIKLISKALITEPDKHLDFSLKSYKQKQCELCVPLEQAFPPICMKPQSPLSDHQILKANSALRANGGGFRLEILNLFRHARHFCDLCTL